MYEYNDWGIFVVKFFDKFLKKLKTDRNTFFTYILTLITAYIVVDRVLEILIMCLTGASVSYWGPIKYTLAMACPVFAFAFSYPSKFAKSDKIKLSFFHSYCIALYVIGISMVVQWVNYIGWFGLLSVPNYKLIFSEFSHLIRPAFTAVSIYIPLMTFYKLVLWLYKVVNDPIFPNNFKESILDFQGIDISGAPENSGPYSFEIEICTDRSTGKPVKILEKRRFDSTLIVGPSGTGKTALIMEPMIARDLEKKFFLRETAKEMGYTALKSGIATLDCPYDKAYMNKMIYTTLPDGKIVYKNLGLTSVTPDFEHTSRILDVAKNFDIPVRLIDPLDPNSVGLNPFILPTPALCGLIISMIIEHLYNARSATAELVYMKDLAYQAIQNVCIFLKVLYPLKHNGDLPTLEDLLKCLTDFDLVEDMCHEIEQDPELAAEYELQLEYFKQHFYKNSSGRKDMQRYVHFATAQLAELLRAGSVRNIICKRNNNINYSDILANGEVVLFCSRYTDIGGVPHRGFGRFFLILLMCFVEGRPGNENTRIPHFLYVDDFDAYADETFGDMITLYRKFKVGTIFAIPNLQSLGGSTSPFMQTLLSNCTTKISFGNCTPEEYAWWEQEFGKRREWSRSNNYDMKDEAYSSNLGGVKWGWEDHMKVAKIQGLKFKALIYKVKDKKGKNVVNFATADFLESKYKEPHKIKTYNFDKYNSGVMEENKKEKKKKFKPKDISFGTDNNIDPVQTDTTDSSYLFDNADAISFNLNPSKKE